MHTINPVVSKSVGLAPLLEENLLTVKDVRVARIRVAARFLLKLQRANSTDLLKECNVLGLLKAPNETSRDVQCR